MRVLPVVFLALLALPAAAQTGGVLGVIEGRQIAPGGYYFNAQPGDPVTRVNLWGEVLRPGVYEVGPDFDLSSVLSLAGIRPEVGPVDGQADVVVTLYRAGDPTPVYRRTLEAIAGDPSLPDLLYGDVVSVESIGVARVTVWGGVSRPGVYEVGPGVSPRELLGLAGGPDSGPVRASETRTTLVRVFGEGAAGPRFSGTLDEFLADGTLAVQDGDVIELETEIATGWTTRDTLTVAGIVTSAAIAVAQFLRLLSVD